MPSETWPEVVKASYAIVWVYGGWAEVDAEVDAFADHWGGFEVTAFKQALRHGKGNEKLFAICALGECALPEAELGTLLTPLLHSSERMERWVSAITLGLHKQEQAFPLLQDMLLEGIFDYVDFTNRMSQELNGLVNAAIDEGDRRLDSKRYWRKLVDPAILEMWERKVDLSNEYSWYFHHRGTIAHVLGAWGDRRAVPALRHALQEAYRIEQSHGPWGARLSKWHSYQDHLAYALGQLEAWGVFITLTAPPNRLNIAYIYFVLGLLSTSLLEWKPIYFPFYLPKIKELIAQGTVEQLLQARCGLKEEECHAYIERFWHCYLEREKQEKAR